jgi:energy-coupling factor transporter ATP-binding protein EcfA2
MLIKNDEQLINFFNGKKRVLVTGPSGSGKSYISDKMKAYDIDQSGQIVKSKKGKSIWVVLPDEFDDKDFICGTADNIEYVIRKYRPRHVVLSSLDHANFVKVMALKGEKDTPFKKGFLEMSKWSKSQFQRQLKDWEDRLRLLGSLYKYQFHELTMVPQTEPTKGWHGGFDSGKTHLEDANHFLLYTTTAEAFLALVSWLGKPIDNTRLDQIETGTSKKTLRIFGGGGDMFVMSSIFQWWFGDYRVKQNLKIEVINPCSAGFFWAIIADSVRGIASFHGFRSASQHDQVLTTDQFYHMLRDAVKSCDFDFDMTRVLSMLRLWRDHELNLATKFQKEHNKIWTDISWKSTFGEPELREESIRTLMRESLDRQLALVAQAGTISPDYIAWDE